MEAIITNGKIVTPWEIIEGVTIGIEGEKVSCVQRDSIFSKAKEVIDACGNYILPGIIDGHTHFGAFLPYEEDVVSETKAAADADLIIVDLEKKQTVTAELFPSSCDYTPYEGWELKGWPVLTMVRGKVVMKDTKIKDASGWGKVAGIK